MGYIIAALYAFGAVVFLVLLIYVLVNRLEERKKENFEQRDN